MFNSQKNVFWQALLVTMFIFGIGVLAGVILENARTGQINSLFQQSEVDLLDIKLQSEIYSGNDFDCDVATQENLNFADRIYEEARLLEQYEKASRLTEDLKIQHKKYDLLRIMVLLNSEKIRNKCENSYDEIVYFYFLETDDLVLKAKLNIFQKVLLETKETYGKDILLVPVGISDEISSINLILDKYNVSREDLPAVVINQKIKLTEIVGIEDIKKYLG